MSEVKQKACNDREGATLVGLERQSRLTAQAYPTLCRHKRLRSGKGFEPEGGTINPHSVLASRLAKQMVLQLCEFYSVYTGAREQSGILSIIWWRYCTFLLVKGRVPDRISRSCCVKSPQRLHRSSVAMRQHRTSMPSRLTVWYLTPL